MLMDGETGTESYRWENKENQVTLYKRDQYGRNVSLGGKWLELSVFSAEGENNTFLTGESIIRLYQNPAKAATKTDGQTLVPNISYDSATGSWTIKGLFDIGKTYTLSEPKSSVPANNIQAKPFSFTMGEDGKITVTSTDAEPKENPLAVDGKDGKDYENYYKSNSVNNIVVLRDVARFLTDVGLEKIDSTKDDKIANISFTLGKYYFQEIEHGASDAYRLLDKIFFEIKPKDPGENPASYEEYAQVIFTTNDFVTQPKENGELGKTGVVKNTPVISIPKTLQLTKVDSVNGATTLSGARFTLTYTSINNGDPGAQPVETVKCKTDTSGVLYRCDEGWNYVTPMTQPDISQKGTYVLEETQAPDYPDYYMTRTPATKVTFKVNSENKITQRLLLKRESILR